MAKKPFQYDQDAEEPWIPNAPRVSRSEQMEESTRARELAGQLVELRPAERDELDLDGSLVAALVEFERISPKKRAARKRKLGHIGSLVESHDLDALQGGLDALATSQGERDLQIDALVRWRTELIADPNRLTDFIEAYPNTDRQRVRQLARAAHKAIGTEAATKSARTLLKAMKEGNIP